LLEESSALVEVDRRRARELDARAAWVEREAGDLSTNPYGDQFTALIESVGCEMERRTIRAWHYTRMTGTEISSALRDRRRHACAFGYSGSR
jgi:hypothetical protein